MSLLDTVKGYFNGRSRPLTTTEINVARRVFQDTLPYPCISITDDLGAGGAAWTEPGLGPFRFYFWLHLGPKYFASTLGVHELLIHELTHVWQGHNHLINTGYVAGSLITQGKGYIMTGDPEALYKYTPGEFWGSYNTEQQATIVEDWFKGGMRESDPLFRYIRDHIRRPGRSWFGEIAVQLGEGASAIKG